MCEETGPRIALENEETLFRHVNPSWLDEEHQPSSQAFYPFGAKDHGCMSVDRGSLTSAAAAFCLFTDALPGGFGLAAVGTWGVMLTECTGRGLAPWSDPVAATAASPSNAAHAIVDFAAVPANHWKKLGRALKNLARSRGRLHPT
jgi:hypothetical protein